MVRAAEKVLNGRWVGWGHFWDADSWSGGPSQMAFGDRLRGFWFILRPDAPALMGGNWLLGGWALGTLPSCPSHRETPGRRPWGGGPAAAGRKTDVGTHM